MIAQVAAQAEALELAGLLSTRERDNIYADAFTRRNWNDWPSSRHAYRRSRSRSSR